MLIYLTVMLTDAMRKAIIFAGGITHLLNLISLTTDDQDLQIYVDSFTKLPIDGILLLSMLLIILTLL